MNIRDQLDQQASMLAVTIEALIEGADESHIEPLTNDNILDFLQHEVLDESRETLRRTLGHTCYSVRFMDAIKRNRS